VTVDGDAAGGVSGQGRSDGRGGLPQVAVVLALYQGARHVGAQLDSIAAQDGVDWRLIVSDDGSEDEGPEMVRQFGAAHPVRLIDGPRQGFAENFLSLLRAGAAEGLPWLALSDQDDVWLSGKLARGVAALRHVDPERPALYCARTVICDDDLNPIGLSSRFRRPPSFRNALVQSIGGGNTMVLNAAAQRLAAAASAEAGAIVAHDWWLYQIVAGAGGVVVHDPEPALHYRQHNANLIGANLSARARAERLRQLLNGRLKGWNDLNLAALGRSRGRLTAEACATLDHYAAARRGPVWRRMAHLRRSGVYRQGRLGTIALHIACLLRLI